MTQGTRKYINPQIQMDYDIDVTQYGDRWNPELNGFMFSATGGQNVSYDYVSFEVEEQNGLYYVKCVDLKIKWADEYGWENGGIVYAGDEEVGTAGYDRGTDTKDYKFSTPIEILEEKQYVLRENGYDETGFPSGYGFGKGYPLFVIESKEIV